MQHLVGKEGDGANEEPMALIEAFTGIGIANSDLGHIWGDEAKASQSTGGG